MRQVTLLLLKVLSSLVMLYTAFRIAISLSTLKPVETVDARLERAEKLSEAMAYLTNLIQNTWK